MVYFLSISSNRVCTVGFTFHCLQFQILEIIHYLPHTGAEIWHSLKGLSHKFVVVDIYNVKQAQKQNEQGHVAEKC